MSKEESWIISIGKLHTTIYNQDQKIADLEAKLAESEENNKLLEMQLQDMERSKLSWENQYFTLYITLKNYREVTEKQLAEIEMELASKVDFLESEKENLFRTLEEANEEYQDKISFAVEQLKETKSYADNQCFMARYKSERKAYASVWNYIDNQIAELTHQHEDKGE